MKRVIYSGNRVSRLKLPTLILMCCMLLLSSAIQSQVTYYSDFDDPTGNYSVGKPNCTLGITALAIPDIDRPENVANASRTDFATFTTVPLSISAICSGIYRLVTSLNIGNLTTISASPTNTFNVGFRISVSEAVRASLASGSNGMTIITYEGNVEKQRSTAGALGLGLLQTGIPRDVSFIATQPFNRVAVELSTGLLNLASGSTIDFYYGFATNDLRILPVKLADFSATVERKGVTINWTSTSETNVARYELQRSSNGSSTFNTITTIAAKGNTATETKYSFMDASALTGNYTYQLKMVDKDGGVEYSKLALVKLAASASWKIYPTLLSSGTDLNINVAATGNEKMQVQLANLQGQILHTVSTITDNKLVVSTNGLSAGIYVLKLYKAGQLQASEKVVIQ